MGGSVAWGVTINPGKVAKAINKDLPEKIEKGVSAASTKAGRKVASVAGKSLRGAGSVLASGGTVLASGVGTITTAAVDTAGSARQFSAALRRRIQQNAKSPERHEMASFKGTRSVNSQRQRSLAIS